MTLEDILANPKIQLQQQPQQQLQQPRCRRGRPSTTLNPDGTRGNADDDQRRVFRCPTCPSKFSYERGLQQHLKYVCYQRPRFQCPYCDYRSKYRYNTYNHVRNSHKGEEVYCIDIVEEEEKYQNW